MKRSERLRQQAETVRGQMRTIADAADQAEGGLMTAEQETEYTGLKAQLARFEGQAREAEQLEASERAAPAVATARGDGEGPVRGRVGAPRSDQDPAAGFRTHRDFLLAVLKNAGTRSRAEVRDERLRPLAVTGSDEERRGAGLAFMLPRAFTPRSLRAAVGSDEHNTSQDEYGGYSIPTTLLPGMLTVGAEGDPSAGRTQAIPMESPQVDILARTDKDHRTSVSGGLVVLRRAEMAAFQASRMKIEKISLKAAMLAGLAYETEELIERSPLSFVALIDAGFRSEFAVRKFREKLRGTGGDEFLGILNATGSAGATVVVPRAAAGQVGAQDALDIQARVWGYDQAIWLANHELRPILSKAAIVVSDGAGAGGVVLVYQQSLQEGQPDRLLGRPIFYTEYASALGDAGDLICWNPTQYLEGTFRPVRSAESIHVRFETHERTFKFWEENCGAPWWRTALTPHKGANTLSPAVILGDAEGS